MMRKLYGQLRAAAEADVGRSLPVPEAAPALTPHAVDLDEDLDDAAKVMLLQNIGFSKHCFVTECSGVVNELEVGRGI